MVKATRRTAQSERKNGSRTSAKAATAEAIAQRICTAIKRKYGIDLATRSTRLSTKVGHACREKLGKDIQAQVDKQRRSGNGNGKSFDWKEWNTTIFPKILGEPDGLQYPVEAVAEAMAIIYDTISTDTNSAIADLVEFNVKSLQRRNEFNKQNDDELDDLDDELEEEADEILEDIDDELDEADLEDELDDEDFDLDDED